MGAAGRGHITQAGRSGEPLAQSAEGNEGMAPGACHVGGKRAQQERCATPRGWEQIADRLPRGCLTSDISKASTPLRRSAMRSCEKAATSLHSCCTASADPSLALSVLLHRICLPFWTLTAAVTTRRPRCRCCRAATGC